jgi:hypothetical protein
MRLRLGPALTLGLAGAAAAQHPHAGPRPFHVRLAAADVVAVVQVEKIDEGRIAVRRLDALAGSPPEAFEVKRSPLRPPPLATGDRALLLLRGDRPPYVLADEPAEVIRLADALMTARWSAAARAALASREDPAALAALYGEWIEHGPESLRELGAAGLRSLQPARSGAHGSHPHGSH